MALFCVLNVSAVLAQTSLGSDINTQATAFINKSGLKQTSISYTIAQIIKAILGFLGVIFIVLIIYAGFLWMTSAGNEEKAGKAKKIITAAIIGLVIVLSAYAITIYVTDKIVGATIRTSTLGW